MYQSPGAADPAVQANRRTIADAVSSVNLALDKIALIDRDDHGVASQITDLSAQLKQLQFRAAETSAERSKLHEERNSLLERLQRSETALREIVPLQQQLIGVLQGALSRSRAAARQLASEQRTLGQTVLDASVAITSLRNNNVEACDKSAALRDRLSESQADAASLRQELAALAAHRDSLQDAVGALVGCIHSVVGEDVDPSQPLDGRYNVSDALALGQKEAASLRTTIADLVKTVEDLEAANNDQAERLEEWEDRCHKAVAAAAEAREAGISGVNAVVEDAQRREVALRESLNASLQAAQSDAAILANRVHEVTAELEEAKGLLGRCKEESASMHVAGERMHKDTLRLGDVVRGLRGELADRSAALAATTMRAEQAESRVEELKVALTELERTSKADLRELNDQLTSAVREASALHSDNEGLRARLEDALAEVARLRKVEEKLSAQLGEKHEQLQAKQQLLDDRNAAIAQLSSAAAKAEVMSETLARMSEDMKEAREAAEAARIDAQQAQVQADAAAGLRAANAEMERASSAAIEELRHILQLREEEINDLRRQKSSPSEMGLGSRPATPGAGGLQGQQPVEVVELKLKVAALSRDLSISNEALAASQRSLEELRGVSRAAAATPVPGARVASPLPARWSSDMAVLRSELASAELRIADLVRERALRVNVLDSPRSSSPSRVSPRRVIGVEASRTEHGDGDLLPAWLVSRALAAIDTQLAALELRADNSESKVAETMDELQQMRTPHEQFNKLSDDVHYGIASVARSIVACEATIMGTATERATQTLSLLTSSLPDQDAITLPCFSGVPIIDKIAKLSNSFKNLSDQAEVLEADDLALRRGGEAHSNRHDAALSHIHSRLRAEKDELCVRVEELSAAFAASCAREEALRGKLGLPRGLYQPSSRPVSRQASPIPSRSDAHNCEVHCHSMPDESRASTSPIVSVTNAVNDFLSQVQSPRFTNIPDAPIDGGLSASPEGTCRNCGIEGAFSPRTVASPSPLKLPVRPRVSDVASLTDLSNIGEQGRRRSSSLFQRPSTLSDPLRALRTSSPGLSTKGLLSSSIFRDSTADDALRRIRNKSPRLSSPLKRKFLLSETSDKPAFSSSPTRSRPSSPLKRAISPLHPSSTNLCSTFSPHDSGTKFIPLESSRIASPPRLPSPPRLGSPARSRSVGPPLKSPAAFSSVFSPQNVQVTGGASTPLAFSRAQSVSAGMPVVTPVGFATQADRLTSPERSVPALGRSVHFPLTMQDNSVVFPSPRREVIPCGTYPVISDPATFSPGHIHVVPTVPIPHVHVHPSVASGPVHYVSSDTITSIPSRSHTVTFA